MKRCLVILGLLVAFFIGCGEKAKDPEQGISPKAADKAIRAIRAILPDDLEIIEVRRGLVAPVYCNRAEGIQISIQRKGVSLEKTKGPAISIHLMKAPYDGEVLVHDDHSTATWPSRYLGKNKTWQVYIHGGEQGFSDKLVSTLKLTKASEGEPRGR